MEIEPLASDLPYPSLSDVEPDPRVLEMFYDAYSAQHSELNAILQYVYHQLIFDSLEMYDVSRVYACIFVSEMEHLHQLGEAIIRLGGNPPSKNSTPKCATYKPSCRTDKRPFSANRALLRKIWY